MAEIQELPASVTQVKKELTTPRDISKQHDPEGRSALASTILGARKEGRSVRASIAEQDQIRQQTSDQFFALNPTEEQTAVDLTQRNESKYVRLKVKLGIGDKKASSLQEQLSTIKGERTALSTQSEQAAHEQQALEARQSEIPNPKELLKAYYEKMQTQPLTNQEKRELLTPEVLESLTTEEYIVLWRRLNPYFLSHVTRQGFRDHNAMVYHSGGLEEFHNGFVGVVEDDKSLRPPLALQGLKSRDENTVRQFLDGWVLQAENPDEARTRLQNLLAVSLASAPSYPDKTAVHFAAQVVADDFYGGENDNEVFFLYPTDVLASQHNFAFNGWGKDFTTPQNETKWNDVFIWPSAIDNPGIPVDAGFVFLPENTPVDPSTGSKYASEIKIVDGKEQRVMIEDAVLVNSFVNWMKTQGEQSPVQMAIKEIDRGDGDEARGAYRSVVTEELQKLGINSDAVLTIATDNSLRYRLKQVIQGDELPDEAWAESLKSSNAQWKRPEQTIPAKEYWENYFAQNPNLRPKHIHYYDGDPTTAIYEFQQKNNIGRADTANSDGELLGFDDHHVKLIPNVGMGMIEEGQDPRVMAGYKEFLEMGKKIIADRYKLAA